MKLEGSSFEAQWCFLSLAHKNKNYNTGVYVLWHLRFAVTEIKKIVLGCIVQSIITLVATELSYSGLYGKSQLRDRKRCFMKSFLLLQDQLCRNLLGVTWQVICRRWRMPQQSRTTSHQVEQAFTPKTLTGFISRSCCENDFHCLDLQKLRRGQARVCAG